MGYRLAAYDEEPRTGMPELFHDKKEFDAYVRALVKAGVIKDASFLWWAMRPSLDHPTLELRAPDSCTLVEDSLAIAALFRVLARRLYRDPKLNADLDSVARAIAVENKWRAQRHGVRRTFVCDGGAISVPALADLVIEETKADTAALGCSRARTLPHHRRRWHLRGLATRAVQCPWPHRRAHRGAAGGDPVACRRPLWNDARGTIRRQSRITPS
jgi:gamma-glutamyl:cysteine ligase YbdK (ATP-grasp superfamily)